MTNSPSGNRFAVGKSIMPGRPKFPGAIRCLFSALALWDKREQTKEKS